MKDIKFPVVVVPESALNDMNMTEQNCSRMLLNVSDYKALSPEEKLEYTVFEHYPHDENFLELADEKVLKYRSEHSYSDVGITSIPVKAIIDLYSESDNLMLLTYIVELLFKLWNRNERLCKLIELDAPDIVVKNEVRLLRKLVDELLVGEAGKTDNVSLHCKGYTILGDHLVLTNTEHVCYNCEAYRCGGPHNSSFNIDECKHKDKILK